MAPLTMWEERNTGSNLPAQIELYADTAPGHENVLQVPLHGQGRRLGEQVATCSRRPRPCSTPPACGRFLDEKLRTLGTSACPPYHLAIVVGGTSAEYALKTAKYASARYLDSLPTSRIR